MAAAEAAHASQIELSKQGSEDVYCLSISDLWHGYRLVAVPFWEKALDRNYRPLWLEQNRV
jgi:hypothetical protein